MKEQHSTSDSRRLPSARSQTVRRPARRALRPGVLLNVIVIALGNLGTAALLLAQDSEPPRLPPVRELPQGFSEELNTVENDALDKLRRKDLRRISIGEMSRFHRRLVRTLDPVLPKGVSIRNEGPLAAEGRRQPLRLNGWEFGRGQILDNDDLSGALWWSVDGDLGIFSFWVSTARTNSTVAVCDVERRKLFLNVDWIADFRSVDDKLPDLGGHSVREVLRLLEQPPPDPLAPVEAVRPPEKPAARADENDPPRNGERPFADFEKLIELIQQGMQDDPPRAAPVPWESPEPAPEDP